MIVVESLKRSLQEAVVIFAQVYGLRVVLLHPMQVLQIALNHRRVWLVHDLLLLLLGHLHPHRLLLANTTVGVFLLEDVSVDAATNDELARLDDMLRQPVRVGLKYRNLVVNLLLQFRRQIPVLLYSC